MLWVDKVPIIYDDLIDVRFSDLDHYNHVNAKHYLDFVATARLNFMARELKMPIEMVTDRGVGFFMKKSSVNYKLPIQGLQRVYVRSHVAEVRDEKILIIPFEILSEDHSQVFADGLLEFAIMDLKTMKSSPGPDWLMALFFTKPAGES